MPRDKMIDSPMFFKANATPLQLQSAVICPETGIALEWG